MIFFGVQCILCNPQSLTIWFYAYLGHLLGSKTKFQHKISQACKFGASVSNKISRQVNKSRNSQACKFGASVSNKIISIPLFACLWLLQLGGRQVGVCASYCPMNKELFLTRVLYQSYKHQQHFVGIGSIDVNSHFIFVSLSSFLKTHVEFFGGLIRIRLALGTAKIICYRLQISVFTIK